MQNSHSDTSGTNFHSSQKEGSSETRAGFVINHSHRKSNSHSDVAEQEYQSAPSSKVANSGGRRNSYRDKKHYNSGQKLSARNQLDPAFNQHHQTSSEGIQKPSGAKQSMYVRRNPHGTPPLHGKSRPPSGLKRHEGLAKQPSKTIYRPRGAENRNQNAAGFSYQPATTNRFCGGPLNSSTQEDSSATENQSKAPSVSSFTQAQFSSEQDHSPPGTPLSSQDNRSYVKEGKKSFDGSEFGMAKSMGQRFIFGDQTNFDMITLPSQVTAQQPEQMTPMVKSFYPSNRNTRGGNDVRQLNDSKYQQNVRLRPPIPQVNQTWQGLARPQANSDASPVDQLQEQGLETMADQRFRMLKHETCLRCLQTCTEWRLEIFKSTEGEDQQEFLGEFQSPTVSYKHCGDDDKSDLIDMLVDRNTQQTGPKAQLNLHPTADVSDVADRNQLERKMVTFPVKNMTKVQNSTITNFQFEQKLKQDTFTLAFDIQALSLEVNASISSNEYLFNINGICHGQPVFSDGIFYMFKGGKMLNCSLSQINKNLIRQITQCQPYIQTAHVFKANNLPKSFGCLLKLSESALEHNRDAFGRLSNRMSCLSLAQQRNTVQRHTLSNQHVPFTTTNLRDFDAHIQKMFFVFNINDEMLKENEFTYRHRDLPSNSNMYDFSSQSFSQHSIPFMIGSHSHDSLQPVHSISLKSEVKQILQILEKRKQLDGFAEQRYQSNFETMLDALKVRANPKIAKSVLNHEESRPTVLSVLERAFQRIDALGLRVELGGQQELQTAIYTTTLSAFRFKVSQSTGQDSTSSSKAVYKELEFGNKAPHYMRGTMLNDLSQALKGSKICSGWLSVLYTRQRSIGHGQFNSKDDTQEDLDVNFIVVYRVCAEQPLSKMIKLKGLYPSVNLNIGSPQLTQFWFSNQLCQSGRLVSDQQPKPSLINFKSHEVMVKVRALKLAASVEELVKEEFPSGLVGDGDGGIDYELCLHQDFLFMLRQRKKNQQSVSSSSVSQLSSGSSWDERPLCPSDIIL